MSNSACDCYDKAPTIPVFREVGTHLPGCPLAVAAAVPSVPEGPVGGYELVEEREDAILMCGYLAHKVVEALNKAHNELTLTWEQSRDSCLAGVRRILDNPKETSEQNHEAWMDYRRKEGWVYGVSKDPVAKTHPCMVPFGALPPIQQAKDMIFTAIVKTFFGV